MAHVNEDNGEVASGAHVGMIAGGRTAPFGAGLKGMILIFNSE